MQQGTRRAVVLATLLLVGSVGGTGFAAGLGQTATDAPEADTRETTLAETERRSSVGSAQYDSHDSIVVTQEYRLTPDEPGRIDIEWRFRIPDRVSDVQTQLPPGATDVRTTRFRRTESGIYEWDGDTSTASITFTQRANETTDRVGPEAADGQLKFADTGDWALIPRQPVTSPGYRYPRGRDPGVTLHNTTAGEGVVGSGLVYLGPHETYERSAHGQRFRLVVPDAAALAPDRAEILESVTDASDRLRVGDRDGSVLMIAAPTSVRWGVLGLQTGPSDFYVLADERLNTPDNTWLHEYVHTRQNVDASGETQWFFEGSAEYYAALLSLQQDRIGYEAFRDQLHRGTWRQFSDVRLVDPSTWRTNGANYYTGALVSGDVDRRIRLATDSGATFQDVFRRMNRQESQVTRSDFLEFVREVGGGSVADPAGHYTETTDRPDPWNQESHQEAFGPLPARFRYDLPEPDSDGTRVRSTYRSGRLGGGSLVPGETLVFDVTVTNVGGRAGEYDLGVSVDGRTIASRTGRLDAGTSATQTVEHTVGEPGNYRISTGENRMTLRVEEPATPVVRGLSTSSDEVRPGEAVTVTASVANPADRPGQRQIAIRGDGAELASEQVELGPGESTEVTATASLSEPGTYRFVVENRSVSVTVTEGSATASGTGDADRNTGSSGPGFGPIPVLLAVAALLLFKRVQ